MIYPLDAVLQVDQADVVAIVSLLPLVDHGRGREISPPDPVVAINTAPAQADLVIPRSQEARRYRDRRGENSFPQEVGPVVNSEKPNPLSEESEAEPEAWTMEVKHKYAHESGSPGLFGFSPQDMRVYIDNVTVTPNN